MEKLNGVGDKKKGNAVYSLGGTAEGIKSKTLTGEKGKQTVAFTRGGQALHKRFFLERKRHLKVTPSQVRNTL